MGLMVILSSAEVKVRAKTLLFCYLSFFNVQVYQKLGNLDGNVYIWHRETGFLLEVLTGHGEGSVNAVAWNPTNERMFASCSDDHSIRIWEPAPSSAALLQSPMMDHSLPHPFIEKGKGKTRQRLDSNGVEPADVARLL